MAKLFFITHPEVDIDPEKPVPEWGLSGKGRERMRVFAASPLTDKVGAIWSSAETKALEAADILAGSRGLTVQVLHTLHENDRTATGFLPPSEFEEVANSFFASPEMSVRGWERAVDAQSRVRTAFEVIMESAAAEDGDIAVISHGAVGTLLLCHLLGEPIDRALDQPGQGHYWTYCLDSQAVLHRWLPIAPR